MGGCRIRRIRARGLAAVVLLVAAGCASHRPRAHAALRAHRPPSSPLLAYQVACPDVLDFRVVGHPEWSGTIEIGPDGCIEFEDVAPIRVESLTPEQVAARVAAALHVPPNDVRVRVSDHRSRHVFLFGQVEGPERALPYQGPETVADLLHRAGGLSPGADLRAVRLVRPNVTIGRRPEVLTADLEAILLRGDQRTNVIVRSDDQVYVAETPWYSVLKFLPDWTHVREWGDRFDP